MNSYIHSQPASPSLLGEDKLTKKRVTNLKPFHFAPVSNVTFVINMQLRFRALQMKHMDTKDEASSPHSKKKQMGTHLPKCLVKYLRLHRGNSTTLADT